MLLSYKWDWLDGLGWVGSLCGATIRASLRDANKAFRVPEVEENGLVTKSSNLSEESLGWPNTQIQIHKCTYTQIQFLPKCADKSAERDHQFTRSFTRRGPRVKKIVPPSQGVPGANSEQRDSLGLARNTKVFFLNEKGEKR